MFVDMLEEVVEVAEVIGMIGVEAGEDDEEVRKDEVVIEAGVRKAVETMEAGLRDAGGGGCLMFARGACGVFASCIAPASDVVNAPAPASVSDVVAAPASVLGVASCVASCAAFRVALASGIVTTLDVVAVLAASASDMVAESLISVASCAGSAGGAISVASCVDAAPCVDVGSCVAVEVDPILLSCISSIGGAATLAVALLACAVCAICALRCFFSASLRLKSFVACVLNARSSLISESIMKSAM